MITIVQALPLVIFLSYLRLINTHIPENWEMPFIVSGSAGIIVILVSVYKKEILNRFLLGFNLYFITGGTAFITHQWWLNNLYSQLQASGLILWVCIIGLATTVVSPYGFIGIKAPDSKAIKTYSAYLLLVSIIAFSLSFGFRGIKLLSELLPFIGLFIFQGFLKKNFHKNFFTKED